MRLATSDAPSPAASPSRCSPTAPPPRSNRSTRRRCPRSWSPPHAIPCSADSLGVSVTVLRGDDLRAQGIRSVGDALRQVPGAQVVQGGGFGAQTSLFLRGGESDYVKVLVDGVPVNQPGGAYDFANLTTDNVERIEVVRGPGSVLYGSDAIAGVVQIVTREGAGAPGASAAGRGGHLRHRSAGRRAPAPGATRWAGRPRRRGGRPTASTTSTTPTATPC